MAPSPGSGPRSRSNSRIPVSDVHDVFKQREDLARPVTASDVMDADSWEDPPDRRELG